MKQAIIKALIVIGIIALISSVGLTMGTQLEDLEAFENCIIDQYDMSSTEYYSLTNEQPVCK